MRLNTLLEFQRCFDLLRRAESQREKLSCADHIATVSAAYQFNAELVAELKDHDMAVYVGEAP